MPLPASVVTSKGFTVVFFLLTVYFNFRTAFGRSFHGGKHYSDRVGNTPFTANIIFVFVYWIITYVSQLFFLISEFSPSSDLYGSQSLAIGWHFSVFNVLQVIWSVLFAANHFILSEIVLLLNLFNVLSLYVSHRTYSIQPTSKWLVVHIPITTLPLTWLFYAIFWNGAVMFGPGSSLPARIIANLLIWDFLVIPGLYLTLYRDWATGFAFSYIIFGIAVCQLFVKVIALQWIFAFVIAALVLIASVIVLFVSVPVETGQTTSEATETISEDEQAPLLHA